MSAWASSKHSNLLSIFAAEKSSLKELGSYRAGCGQSIYKRTEIDLQIPVRFNLGIGPSWLSGPQPCAPTGSGCLLR